MMIENDVALIIEKISTLNQLRRERAVENAGRQFKLIYNLLPSLLHFNHPQLPGYREGVPQGVFGYSSEQQQHLLHFPVNFETLSYPHSTQIAGLYSIGSTGSLGQSKTSDLDIWVCVEKYVDHCQCNQLQKKCDAIERWAISFGIELNLFVLYENRFKEHNEHHISGEHCGSTQHMLLLEEFYRTATCLMGKPLLWYIIPSTKKINRISYYEYDHLVQELCDANKINLDEWVDFGPLTTLSPEEYFGASLWQIYKSINSPYKSVLKALLLESYTYSYPETLFLASEMKQNLTQIDDVNSCHFDHYYLMLKRVSDYLVKINDNERLKLARYCFYLKIREKLSQETHSCTWCRSTLQQLINEWGWNKEILQKLDGYYTNWTVLDIKRQHEALLTAMMKSYRHLVRFGQRNNLDAFINPRDIAVLTRKLYAMYESLPAKVTLLNEQVVTYLQEDDLTFIYVAEEKINRKGWYLYNSAPRIDSIVGSQPVEFHFYLMKLILWSYCNYLLSEQTQLYIIKNGHKCHYQVQLQRLLNDLITYFPRRGHYATEDELYNVSEIRQLLLVVNFENESEYPEKMNRKTLAVEDVLNVQNKGEIKSLVSSIDVIYRNSWNEVKTDHFAGVNCILDMLKMILGTMHRAARAPELVQVLCYQPKIGDKIAQQVRSLLEHCITLRLSSNKQNLAKFKSLQIAGINWGIFFERLGVNFCQFDESIAFYDAISSNKLQRMKLMEDNQSSKLPDVISHVASKGLMQFFFEEEGNQTNLYVLNENNKVEIYRNCSSRNEIVKNINQYYALSTDRNATNTATGGNFNFPHFYQLVAVNQIKQVVPLYFSEDEYSEN